MVLKQKSIKMKTREQAEARALELYPIHEEFDVDRLKPFREAFLAGVEWEKERAESTNGKNHETFDTKENKGSELPSEKQQKKQTCGFCVEPASKTIKEAFDNIPKEVRDRHAKAAYEEDKQLRETAEKVVELYKKIKEIGTPKVYSWGELKIAQDEFEYYIEQLEKALK
jgi:hypothetical protein